MPRTVHEESRKGDTARSNQRSERPFRKCTIYLIFPLIRVIANTFPRVMPEQFAMPTFGSQLLQLFTKWVDLRFVHT